MPASLLESGAYDPAVVVPTSLDAVTLAGLVTAFQALANRTGYLKGRALLDGEVFAGPKTVNAGAHGLLITGGAGSTNISRTVGTVTVSGGGGATVASATAASLSGTGTGTANVTTAGGDVTVRAGGAGSVRVSTTGAGDVSLDSAAGIALNAATNVTTAASKLSLTGPGHPSRATPIPFADVPARLTWLGGQDFAKFQLETFPNGLGAIVRCFATSSETGWFEIDVSRGCVYTAFKVFYDGSSLNTMPATMPSFFITKDDGVGHTAQLSPIVTDPTTSLAAYNQPHDVALPLTAPTRPGVGEKFLLRWVTATGGGTFTDARVFGIRASGSCDRFGVGAEPI